MERDGIMALSILHSSIGVNDVNYTGAVENLWVHSKIDAQ